MGFEGFTFDLAFSDARDHVPDYGLYILCRSADVTLLMNEVGF